MNFWIQLISLYITTVHVKLDIQFLNEKSIKEMWILLFPSWIIDYTKCLKCEYLIFSCCYLSVCFIAKKIHSFVEQIYFKFLLWIIRKKTAEQITDWRELSKEANIKIPFVKGNDNSQIILLVLKARSHVIIIISQYF